jgi:agmatinase
MNEIEYSGKRNFLGLPEAYCAPELSHFQVVPVPYDVTATYMAGARFGPQALIDASAALELYDHELGSEPARAGVATLREVPVDIDPARMQENIGTVVESILSSEKIPVVLGGEHTVSLAAVKALARREKFMVVSLDAHADLRDTYQGSPLSHACFLRRASEWADCCALGVRSLSKGEADYAARAGLKLVHAEQIVGPDRQEINLDFIPEHIYLSIDLDVLDPSIMPATGTPEPGGLDWYTTIDLLKRIVDGRKVLGFDVVELCPQPGNPAPDFTAAKLVYKLMGLSLSSSANQGEGRISHDKEETEEAGRSREERSA